MPAVMNAEASSPAASGRTAAVLKAAYQGILRLDGANADESGRFYLARWFFLRLLGVVYLSAFLSFGSQVQGLIGSHGILPAARYLQQIEDHLGSERYYLCPTLCWLDRSDGFLDRLCLGGAALAVLLIAGVAPAPVLLLLWACYLSLCTAGQIFMGYQWDSLLLETGLLAVLLAPGGLWPRLARERPPSRPVVWLLWLLLIRLMVMSGAGKLLSGDPTWRDGTALEYHYWTQPLPTWTSWYMNQLPGWFQRLSVLITFVLELVMPLLIVLPRYCRYVAFAGLVGLQLLIAGTGNYGFFNLLTIALCVLLLDDAVFPARWRGRLPKPASSGSVRPSRIVRWAGAACLALLTVVPLLAKVGLLETCPRWLISGYRMAASFQSVNSYGLFAVMTTHRYEIEIQGSEDGKNWQPYLFKWKPGPVDRRPEFVPLHMPRLDWQMWFEALGQGPTPWFRRFLIRLALGSPEVLELLEHNPFPDHPPRYLRAMLYDYHFTDPAERRKTGAWWRRRQMGVFCEVK
jgi:hypothetical protein